MRKFLITFLAALACGLTIAAFGCVGDPDKNSSKEYSVVFTPTENLEYVCDKLEEGESTLKVKSGTVVSFSVKVPFLYAVPTVYANNNPVSEKDGVYSVSVTRDITITTGEVKHAEIYLAGSGTVESPILISTPEEYFTVAELINEGNPGYLTLYYALNNDIDFGGEEIPVIGDGSTASSYFMGNFNGNGYTLSNFKIKTNGVSYVGLFGYLVSSGQGDDTGVVVNLNIDNFEITAQSGSSTTMFVGSLVGYSMASSVIACSATNGSILVQADRGMFSYVGGAIGVQTSAIIANGDSISYYPSTTGYVYTDVYIEGINGVLTAGGVVGYVISEDERSISSVINCYSEGDVSGGIYSGGVVGNLSDYSSMANCYSLSFVYSNSIYRDNEMYSDSYAGGLAGYIGNNSVITDSFTLSEVDGQAVSGTVHKGAQVGGYAEATATLDKGLLINCYSGSDVGTTTSFFKNTLYWQECDWVFENGSYPVINQAEAQENNFTVTFDYSGRQVKDRSGELQSSIALDISLSEDFYSPLFYHYGEEFSDFVLAESGETSYGYFFDAELSQKVPYGFIPTRSITLYTGFANYGEVEGKYHLVSRNSKKEITLILNKNGSYTYNDGVEITDFYTYDGTKLLFNNALFARLSDYVSVSTDASGSSVARPDYNYNFAKFAAKKVAGGLEIYDGSFFTEAEPLKANSNALSGEWYKGTDKYVFYTDLTGTRNGEKFTYTLSGGVITINVSGSSTELNVDELSKYDVFKGVWEVASNISRRYEFDEINGVKSWTYKVKGATVASGTYTIGGDGVATLSSGITVQIDASGLLLVKNGDNSEYFMKKGSFGGIWFDFENNVIIYLDGFGSSLTGVARIKEGGSTSELTYILDGFFDGNGKINITLLNGYMLFGYLTCNEDGTLAGTFFSANTASYLEGYKFYLLDTLDGEWVGEGTLNGVPIDSLEFNGLGLYENQGSVTVNGKDGSTYTYTLDENFFGIFGEYKVEFDDENNLIKLTLGSETVQLWRKDEISSYVLIWNDEYADADDDLRFIKFTFNGGGDLSNGGKLTVTDANGTTIATLGYKNTDGSVADLDLVIELYSEFRGGTKVGEITIEDYKFVFDYDGDIQALSKQALTLTIDNPFTGSWRVSNYDMYITIEELDLSNTVDGFFLDMGITTFTYNPEYKCMQVSYITGEMTTPAALYLIMLSEGNMAISSYIVLTVGDYLVYCAPGDSLYGEWSNAENSQQKIGFDGMGDSLYTVGIAKNNSGELFYYTHRFGKFFLWSSDGEKAYTVELNGDRESAGIVYRQGRSKWIVLNDFDIAASILNIEDDGKEYDFYLTHVEVDGVRKSYTLARVNGDITELVIYENEDDTRGVRYIINHAEKTIEQAN